MEAEEGDRKGRGRANSNSSPQGTRAACPGPSSYLFQAEMGSPEENKENFMNNSSESEENEGVDKPTKRLALFNMNWYQTSAADIMALCTSFVPPSSVRSVTIYPPELGSEQNKLTDHFAIIVCDSNETAAQLYCTLDRHDYLKSGYVLDLRVVTDDKIFDQKAKKDFCDKIPSNYKPPKRGTYAL